MFSKEQTRTLILAAAFAAAADGAPAFAHQAGHAAKPGAAAPAAATRRQLEAIRLRGEALTAGVRVEHEARIAALSQQIEVELRADATQGVARLAVRLHVPASELTAEQHELEASWSDLAIARLARAGATRPIATAQVLGLHRDGMSWTMVAYGLGTDVERFAEAIEDASRAVAGGPKATRRGHSTATVAGR